MQNIFIVDFAIHIIVMIYYIYVIVVLLLRISNDGHFACVNGGCAVFYYNIDRITIIEFVYMF